MPQRRINGCPSFFLPSSIRKSRCVYSYTSFYDKKSYISSTISAPPLRTRAFLALRRLLRALLATRRVRTLADRRVISWAIRSIPFANVAIVSKSGVGELPW